MAPAHPATAPSLCKQDGFLRLRRWWGSQGAKPPDLDLPYRLGPAIQQRDYRLGSFRWHGDHHAIDS